MATKTSKNLADSKITQLQELGSAWVFKRAIQDNQTWNKWQDIKGPKDKKTFTELKNIWQKVGGVSWYDSVDDQWLESFHKQQKALLKEIGKPKFTEFARSQHYTLPGSKSGETFMEWVSDLIKDRFEIGNKDNWNPADIWLIKDEDKWRKKIKEAMNTPKRSNRDGAIAAQLAQFNEIFRGLYATKNIIGISLKKVGSGPAIYKEVNVSQKFFKNLKSTEMKFNSAKCLLGVKTINIDKKGMIDLAKEAKSIAKGRGETGFPTIESQDTVLIIKHGGKTFKVQIKANDSTAKPGSNLKFEPTEQGRGAARMGKATRELVFDLMKDYDIFKEWKPYSTKNKTNPEEYQSYPYNIDEFCGPLLPDSPAQGYDRQYNLIGPWKEYYDMIDYLGKQRVTLGPNQHPMKAVVNLKETFQEGSQPWVANNKCMQISWLYAFYKGLKTKKLKDKFCTDLIFLASKEGERYGPFGKIY
tara:strand:+ start:41 stop:1453 length:1413 start_codon:yes stop_codon:yes gene_type:complete